MAFTYNSSSKVTGLSTANPVSFSFTAGTNSRLVVLALPCFTNVSTGTSGTPTYNGNNMIRVGSYASSAEGSTDIWYYLAPDAGIARTISIPNVSAYSFRYACIDFTNATMGAEYFNLSTASDGSGADVVGSIASVPDGSAVVSCMVHGEKDQFASVSGCTTLLTTPSVDEGSTQTGAAYSIQAGTGTATHTYTSGGTADDYNYVMGAWKEVAATSFSP